MEGVSYIQVILPLKLEWEPWYRTEERLSAGQRVRVRLSGREYVAVVSRVSDTPGMDPSGVHGIEAVESSLEVIGAEELKFWHFISEYYMCTVGEVYKTAYPKGRTEVEGRKSRSASKAGGDVPRKRLSDDDKRCVTEILEHFSRNESVLFQSWEREAVYAELSRRAVAEGRDVLILRPRAARESFERQREAAKSVRSATATVIDGHRSNLFLPWRKLSLVIVDDEHSSEFKQKGIAPRYNARDAALMLARIHGANVILGSPVPSLESIYNAAGGKLSMVRAADGGDDGCINAVDTGEEIRKNGMRGSFSRRAVAAMQKTFDSGGRVLLLLPWKNTDELEIEARQLFPKARTKLHVLPLSEAKDLEEYGLVVLLRADKLLSGGDFRSDEKMLRTLSIFRHGSSGRLLIQGSDIGGRLPAPDAVSRLLEERREYCLPPFSRLVEITVSDSNVPRLEKMSHQLADALSACAERIQGPLESAPDHRTIQLILQKDTSTEERKKRIRTMLSRFQREKKYTGHIAVNVDPL